jgi:hypothetical protein
MKLFRFSKWTAMLLVTAMVLSLLGLPVVYANEKAITTKSAVETVTSAVYTASGNLLFSDDFEDGNSNGWSGSSGYSVAADGSTMVFKQIYTTGSTTRYQAAGDSAWTSYSVEAWVKSYTENNVVGVFGRYRSADNHYGLRIHTANNTVILNKMVNGTSTTLGSYSMTLNPGIAYLLKLEMDGSTITGYVDNVPVITVTDTSFPAGRIAVGGYSKGSYAVDNVQVVDKRIPTRMTAAPQNAVLLKDESRQYTAAVYDQSNLAMTGLQSVWTSADPTVAIVSPAGVVTGIGAGSTTIQAAYGSLSAQAPVTVQELVPETPLNTLRTLSPIVTDGVLDEGVWTINRTARKTVTGTTDNTVMFGTLYDADYLYVGVSVTDPDLWNDSKDAYDDDSVEVFLDADHSRGSVLDIHDWHFRKGYNDTALFERLNETVGAQHAWSAVDGGYTVELAIPWKNLGMTPSAGMTLGFDLAVNDDDNGGTREGQLVWSGIADNYKNTMGYGELTLSAATVGMPPIPPAEPQHTDRYVTPAGAGLKDGTSWANAFQGDLEGGLQTAWEATGRTNTLFVGSGIYTVPQTLNLTGGGQDLLHMKKLAGVDTGAGKPVFQGDYTLANQLQRSFINVPLGVSYWQIDNIIIRNYFYGIYVNGQHEGIRVFDVDVHDMSDGIYFWGRATRSNPAVGTHDILVKGGQYTNYTKSAVRFRNGNYMAAVISVNADAGGQANWAPGNFPMGIRIGNSPAESDYIFEHDIVFQDVVSRNSWHQDDAGSYWNGDGFTAERAAYNITYLRSKAFDNTDGGWDDKSRNPVLIDTVSFGNKRNYRYWSADKATFIRTVGGYSFKRGGSGDSVGLWVGGNGRLDAYFSTFFNNLHSEVMLEEANQVRIYDSIIAKTNGTNLFHVVSGSLESVRNDEYVQGVKGIDPQFVNGTNAEWEGGSTDFNSQAFGTSKGYHYPGPNTAPYTVQLQAAPLNLGLLGQQSLLAQVLDEQGNPVSDPESVIWYSEDASIARLLQSRGAGAVVQGLYAGVTEIVAVYKGAEARIQVTVAP